ncbi:clostripain-related cysteine peptidase [Galactobacillus timonensis]|uniref:clostripain-related cysteine peptidase n=1 Tax=Galactobacillus timonensis TaxID=2041840 RepID=UPI000C8224C6|nr:clostripain-related cysteine peptidase [Galactobacillus timonensis]
MMKTKHSALLMAGLLTVGAILSGCTDTETAVSDPMNRMTNAGPGVGSSESGWTIMVYLCGSDLESSGGLASLNLEEMCSAVLPEDVNVLVETGGTSTWYWDGIETDVLGRYQVMDGSLEEAETVELASMGDPSTLTGFIQWGIETYPSEHYGLILWDHGGGNADGVCYDELYDGDNLTLPELGSALNDTGVTLDFIGFDACLMASFETAKAISGFGYYMVASEETEPGQGWDYESMLNAIGEDPSMQGDALGKVICDAFLDKCLRLDCADEATLSVIDLSAVDMLDRTFDEYTSGMAMAADDVEALNSVASAADQTESYGGNTDAEGYCNMVDVADLVSNTQDYVQTDGSGLLRAIDEAVVYSVHGDSRENSHGISVFYPIEVTEDELSVYIQNSDNTPYLQYIAAVTDTYGDVDWDQEWADYDSSVWWSSSEEDVQELLTDMQPVSGSNFDVQYEQTSGDDGYLHLSITSGLEAVKSVHFLLWYMTDGSEDGSASEFVYLGEDNNIDSDWENGRFKDNFFGQWMTIGGEYVNAELIEETESYNRYSIPAEVNGKETNIRAIYDYSTETYRVLGTYDGVESSDGIGSMTSRGITPLQEGDEIVFLLPAFQADSEEENWYYTDAVEWSDDIIMEDEDMGDGYYMYMFEITDIFGVEYDTEPVIMQVEGDTVYQIAE